jgi:hypothetical protein
MGLLDTPLVSEMDAIERKARQGDTKALTMIFNTMPKIKQVYIQRLVRNGGLTLRQAFERAGILVCIR